MLAFALARPRANEQPLPELSLWLLAFAGWLLVQSLLREPAYPQLPLTGMLYVLFAAQLAWLGRALALRFGATAVVDVLAGSILAAAGLNAAIAMLQFYGFADTVPGLGYNPGQITGHVGQRNLLADFLGWGVASLLYLQARGRLGPAAGALCGALLVLGSAYTQSRSALVFSSWLAFLSLMLVRAGAPWRQSAVRAALLCLSTVAVMLALPHLHELLGLQRGLFALDRLVDAEGLRVEARPAAWLLALRLFAEQPWLGVGWGEFAGAAFEVGDDVRAAYVERDAETENAFVPRGRGKWLADLPALARRALLHCGVSEIHGGELCTHSDPQRFYSYRRDGETGRMAALIWLEGEPYTRGSSV